MANDVSPFWEDGDEIPCVAKTAVIGQRLVQISGNREGTISGSGIDVGLVTTAAGYRYQVGLPNGAGAAGAGQKVVGVACWDAGIGGEVTVMKRKILPVLTSGVIAAGAEVEVAADGTVITLGAGKAVGMAMSGAGNGAVAEILVY